MANLNKVMLIGRLTRDPEVRQTPSGQTVADMGLAVNRTWMGKDGNKQEDTCFVDITAWGKTAEFAQQYLAKGRQVFVEGYLKYDQWQTPEGQKRNKLTVTADNIQFLDSRGDNAGGAGGGGEMADGGARRPDPSNNARGGGRGAPDAGAGRGQRQPYNAPRDDYADDQGGGGNDAPAADDIPF